LAYKRRLKVPHAPAAHNAHASPLSSCATCIIAERRSLVHRVPRSASEHRLPVADPFAAILLEQGSTTRGRRRRTAPAVVSDHHHRFVTLVHQTKMFPSIRGPRHQAKSRPRHRAPLSPQHQSSARNRAPSVDERREAVSPISVERQQEPTQPGASCWRADPATDSDVHCSPERPFQRRPS
jgi:hypothetical protein